MVEHVQVRLCEEAGFVISGGRSGDGLRRAAW